MPCQTDSVLDAVRGEGVVQVILRSITAKEWALIALTAVLVLLMVYLELEIPGYMSEITTYVETGADVDLIVDAGLRMLACAFGTLILSVVVSAVAAWVAASLARRLRRMEFERVESFSIDEMNRFSTASLITRSTNDITQIQNTIAIGLVMLMRAPIMAVMAITKIADKNWEWTLTTAVAVILLLAVIVAVMLYVIPRFKRIQWLTDDVNRVTRENLSGIRVVRAYNAEGYQEEKFDRANDNLTGTNLSANRALAFMMPTMMAGISFLSLAIYAVGAVLIDAAGMVDRLGLFSDLVVFSSYAIQVVMSFVMIVVVLMMLPRAMVAAKRVGEVIDTEPSIRDGPLEGSPDGDLGTVEFRDVSFAYPGGGGDVLSHISFKAGRGETVAVIGSTGSGKTTLVNLIPRFFDVTSGEVLVDGIDVRQYKLGSLRRKIGYVSQGSFLFAGDVMENVRYGDTRDQRTEEDVRRALDIAQATEFIDRTEGGIRAPVSQGGTNFSGGQRQRLSIARAVCRHPEIMIFDDSFSALDYRTDRRLRRVLDESMAGTTRLIVAQRIGTIMNADRIIVLDEGRVVGMGSHEELLRTCPVYLDIARSQLSEKELGI